MTWNGTDGLREGLMAQRVFLSSRVPSYARILEILEAELDVVVRRVESAWADRTFDAWYERPLLLLGGMRYEALLEGPTHPLHAAIAAEPGDADAVTRERVLQALAPDRERLSSTLAKRFIQTNESSRAVAWMWVGHLVEQVDPGRSTALADLGCSAGLNLVADALGSPWIDAEGRPLPTAPLPTIGARLGVDLRPLDALDPDAATWLRACVWPGETVRLARLDESLAALRRAADAGAAPRLDAMSIDAAPARLGEFDPAMRVIAYQTIMRDYVPGPVKDRYFAAMRDWIGSRPPGQAIWVELENTEDFSDPERLSAITVHLRAGDGLRTIELARTGPHPHRLFVDPGGVRALRATLIAGAALR